MEILISLLVIVGVILIVGAWRGRARMTRGKAVLMAVAGLVLLVNAAIWIIPTEQGGSLLDAHREQKTADEL